MLRTTLIILSFWVWACAPDDKETFNTGIYRGHKPVGKSFTYLALGDSYTIGTAIGEENSYASLLADSLEHHDSVSSVELDIIARNGWTTVNLLNALDNEKPAHDYDLVSLLIGVNNQYQGQSKLIYRNEFTTLLEQAIQYAGGDTTRIVVLSIPDWGTTPAGAADRSTIAADMDAFNAINKEVAEAMHVTYVDITPVSRTATGRTELVASDQLHFSAEMHALWLSLLYDPAVYAMLP